MKVQTANVSDADDDSPPPIGRLLTAHQNES